MAIQNGKRTLRGIGVTRTVSCQMRAMWGNGFGSGTPEEVPNPCPQSLPGVRLGKRQGMYIKYFDGGHDATGTFFLVEKPFSRATLIGYPLHKVLGPDTRKQGRVKQVYVPMTGSIRIYAGGASVEPGVSLEFG